MKKESRYPFMVFLLFFGVFCQCLLRRVDAFVISSTTSVLLVRPLANSHDSSLSAVDKIQSIIYDEAEFVSILSFLILEESSSSPPSSRRLPLNFNLDDLENTNLAPQRAGYLTFVVGTSLESTKRIIGVKMIEGDDDSREGIPVEKDVFLYTDSVAELPPDISDEDAISTAAAALCGVHCGMPRVETIDDDTEREILGTTVVLGGGEYACFTANGLSVLGANVNLVTTRPMALKDTPLNPLRDTAVNVMPPVTEDKEQLGFCEKIGRFQTCIDTLGDEAKLGMVSTLKQGIDRFKGETGVASKLKESNQCQCYVSSLTRSQRIVLEEGLLFARNAVTKYQKQVEKNFKQEDYLKLVPPHRYGNTLQKLFDGGIIFPTDRNENGSHKYKEVFVRGCSFPDYAEKEIWPMDTLDGAPVRYGFPGIEELTMEARIEEILDEGGRKTKQREKKEKRKRNNPFVKDLDSLAEIKEAVVEPGVDCVLFLSAPYCKMCRTIDPKYTRIARIFKEEKSSSIIFAKASTVGKDGKQLTYTLGVESVPSFILFKKGIRYGEPLGATKLPSAKLDLAIQYLEEDKDWDPKLFQAEENWKKEGTRVL